MKKSRVAIWRRRLGVVSAALGFLWLSIAAFILLRYASDNLHVQERFLHAQALVLLWKVSFCGSALLLVVSLAGTRSQRRCALLRFVDVRRTRLALFCGIAGVWWTTRKLLVDNPQCAWSEWVVKECLGYLEQFKSQAA